jgi:peptidoglycan/LPS O-acetylase OafA/YrhL
MMAAVYLSITHFTSILFVAKELKSLGGFVILHRHFTRYCEIQIGYKHTCGATEQPLAASFPFNKTMGEEGLIVVSVIPVEEKGETPRGPGTKSVRLHYLDWLRVLAILGVIIFHAVHPFDHISWHIKDSAPSVPVTLLTVSLYPWGMPLFFLISGVGSWFALKRRTGRQYTSERVTRLGVPFLVGSLLLTPIMAFFETSHMGLYEGSFTDFVLNPGVFKAFFREFHPLNFSPRVFAALGYHLWFLGFLFAFSLIALPLFLWLRGDSGRRLVERLGWLGEKRGGLLLLIVPLTLIQVVLRPPYPTEHDWAGFATMLVFFVSGYVIYSEERLTQAIRRDWPLTMALGLVTSALILSSTLSGIGASPSNISNEIGLVLQWTVLVVNGLSWSLFILSMGMRYLDFRNRWLEYGQTAIMPLFLLHQPVIIAIAYYVVQWDTGIAVKLPVVLLGSLTVTLAIFEGIIKRIKPLRAFFGIK